ncbi:porin family protein [Arcobacter arenosus]|uniref:Porin family protein n=1 Tax=Arcobacter arenosus TaxID=2576037 RepID=A0A5R8Y364_9BACT|nr:porin family protein [Arcobacter arenosus]TLP40514.1 porin family protein [Arcobacter arenosus]
MKKYINLSLITLVSTMGASTFKLEESWKLEGRLSGYFQHIDVEGQSNNTEGLTQSQELNLNYHGPLYEGNAGVRVKARATNDDRIQDNMAEIQYFNGHYTNKYWKHEIGDVAASMNPYVYGGSLKGFKTVYKSDKKENKWDYKFILGVKKSQWRETYQTVESEPLDTYTAAFEAKYTYERAKEINLSVVTLKDDLSSADSSSAPGSKGLTFGVDGKWRFNKYITLKGRTAVSHSTDDLRAGKESKTKTAILVRLLTRPVLSSVKSNFLYQRIAPDFVSVAGSANSDNEKVENMTTWRINKQLSSKLSFKYDRDNLNGSLGDTQNTYYEAVNITYKPEFLKRSNIDLRFTNKDVRGRGSDNNRYTIDLSGNYRTTSGFRYSLAYNFSDLKDYVTTTSSQKINNIRFTLGYKKKLENDSFYRITTSLDAQNVNQSGNSQEKFGLKVDAGYQYNKKLSMDLSYISRNTYIDNADDTTNSTYQFRTTYRLDDKGKQIVRLLVEKQVYDVEHSSLSSYNEHKGKLSYVYNF